MKNGPVQSRVKINEGEQYIVNLSKSKRRIGMVWLYYLISERTCCVFCNFFRNEQCPAARSARCALFVLSHVCVFAGELIWSNLALSRALLGQWSKVWSLGRVFVIVVWRKKESGHHRQCGFYSLLSSVKVNSSKICQISLILRHLLNKIYCAKFHCNCAKLHLNCAIFHWRFSRILPNRNCANFHWYCAIFN